MTVQTIRTNGQDVVVMPLSEYEVLEQNIAIECERKRVKQMRKFAIPHMYLHRVLNGEHPIKVYREWRGLTQRQLAETVGVAQSYIGNMETGKRKGDIFIYVKIADALGLMVDDIAPSIH